MSIQAGGVIDTPARPEISSIREERNRFRISGAGIRIALKKEFPNNSKHNNYEIISKQHEGWGYIKVGH